MLKISVISQRGGADSTKGQFRHLQGGSWLGPGLPILLVPIILSLAAPAGFANEIRLAAWNLEHLDDKEGEGCLGRQRIDYEALEKRVARLNADVVAFQEVENPTAARRVFPREGWHVEMSSRPPMDRSHLCRGNPSAKLGHLGTGFAIRRGVPYRRHDDLANLAMGNPYQRWGTDITVNVDGRELRLLSVHLTSGCWGRKQDGESRRRKTCATLRGQMRSLKAWANARSAEGKAFVILGDFNRRLALPGDWAWRLLSPPEAPLRLLSGGVASRCDHRYPAFIDHLVAGGGAEAMQVRGSFGELPRRGRHPDHCAIWTDFR